ncbi:MAG: NAD(P)H-binding protein [Bacteroidota bacterium]|nr:NAD(P)H-binding protein [Bacteroidota bacterium]
MILITGATGKVGSKTTDILIEKGAKLRLIARHADKLQKYAGKAEIKVGDITDEAFITEQLKGVDVALLMMPTDFTEPNVTAHQDAEVKSLTAAVKNSGIKKVVVISSVGGHSVENTGIVSGLAKLEIALKAIANVDILFFRPSYFMENLMGNIGMIKTMGINGGTLKGDLSFPMIATQDIAKAIVPSLLNPNFTGKTIQPLLGPKDYTMNEVTKVLGAAIGKPDLKYVEFPFDQAKAGMVQMGISESMADAYNGLSKGANEGIFNTEIRNAASTTPTTIEEFAHTFAYVYNM